METSKEKTTLIKTSQELSECLYETHIVEIDLEVGGGWIKSKKPTRISYNDNLYLSTHTFTEVIAKIPDR